MEDLAVGQQGLHDGLHLVNASNSAEVRLKEPQDKQSAARGREVSPNSARQKEQAGSATNDVNVCVRERIDCPLRAEGSPRQNPRVDRHDWRGQT